MLNTKDTEDTESGESSIAPTIDENPRTFVAINKEDKDKDITANTTKPANTNDQVAEKEPPLNVGKRKRDVETKASARADDLTDSASEKPEVNVKKVRGRAKVANKAKKGAASGRSGAGKKGSGKAKVKNEKASEEQEGKGISKSRETDGEEKELKKVGEESGGEDGQPESSDAGLNTPPPEEGKKSSEKFSTTSTKPTKQRGDKVIWTPIEDQLIIEMAQGGGTWKDVMTALNKLPSCTTPRDDKAAKRRWHGFLKHTTIQWEEDEITKLKFFHQEIVKSPFGVIADRMNAAFPSKKFSKVLCEKKIKELNNEDKGE